MQISQQARQRDRLGQRDLALGHGELAGEAEQVVLQASSPATLMAATSKTKSCALVHGWSAIERRSEIPLVHLHNS